MFQFFLADDRSNAYQYLHFRKLSKIMCVRYTFMSAAVKAETNLDGDSNERSMSFLCALASFWENNRDSLNASKVSAPRQATSDII